MYVVSAWKVIVIIDLNKVASRTCFKLLVLDSWIMFVIILFLMLCVFKIRYWHFKNETTKQLNVMVTRYYF